MKVLIACEYSGTVRDAFIERGHDAWSNDIIDTERNQKRHIKGDCMVAIKSRRWDLIIIHIPCTAMAVCGNRTYGLGMAKNQERLDAIKWSVGVWETAKQYSDKVVMENPASTLFPVLRDLGAIVQYVQPYQFGHLEQKKTGFALHGVKKLNETENVYKEMMKLPKNERERVFYMSPGKDRAKERARFYTGFAEAMAEQWGKG